MKHIREYVVGISLVAYSIWMLYNVIYGITIQVTQFLDGSIFLEYFAMSWYIYLGSWIMFVFMALSAYRCIRANLSLKSWKYICVSGIFGLLAYCVPMVTFSIYNGRFHNPLPLAAVPIVIILVGIACRSKVVGTKPYIPILSLFKNKR